MLFLYAIMKTMTTYTWIYTLADPVENNVQEALEAHFSAFLSQWKTHGTPVQGRIENKYGRFVIVQADPSDGRPSGCSIDSMRHGVEAILQQHKLTWLDNGMVTYRASDDSIQSIPFREIPALLASGDLGADTTIFDNTLSQTDDLNLWEKPLAETWMKRYLVGA